MVSRKEGPGFRGSGEHTVGPRALVVEQSPEMARGVAKPSLVLIKPPVVTIQGCVYMGSVSVMSEHMDDMARQAPPSTGIPRRGYWSGQPFPPPGDLSHSGIKPTSPGSPALLADFFTAEPPGKPRVDNSIH